MKLEGVFQKGKAAFMPYLCCGDQGADFTLRAAKALADAGADAIELGIPFSDPIADGKTIQAASMRALQNGMTPAKALDTLGKMRKETGVPIILMTYYNIILANGGAAFLKKAHEAGAEALIAPDVPLEESAPLHEACSGAGMKLIRMVSVSSDESRIKRISKVAGGFIYAVGSLGTTGARDCIGDDAAALVKRVRRVTQLPVAVGFGVSRPDHATALAAAGADGVIVGSAIADAYMKGAGKGGAVDEDKALEGLASYARAMKAGCVTRI